MSVSLFLGGVLATMAFIGPVFQQEGAAPPVTIIEVPFTTPPDPPLDTTPPETDRPETSAPLLTPPVATTIPVRSVQESGVSGSAGLAEGTGVAPASRFHDDGVGTEASEDLVTGQGPDRPERTLVPLTEPSQIPEAASVPDASGLWVLAVVAGSMVGLVLLLGLQTWWVVRYGDDGDEIRAPGPRSGAYFIGRFDDQGSDESIPERENRVS